MTKTCACGCPQRSGDFEGMCGCPAGPVCLCMPDCAYCDNRDVPAPGAALEPQTAADAAERVQRWLDAVRAEDDRLGRDLHALLEDRKRMAAELEQVRGERAAIPENRYPGAWAELTGWVEEAVDDGGPIDGRELLAYMIELRHKERAEAREWMRGVFGAVATDPEGRHSAARDATERGVAPEGSVS